MCGYRPFRPPTQISDQQHVVRSFFSDIEIVDQY